VKFASKPLKNASKHFDFASKIVKNASILVESRMEAGRVFSKFNNKENFILA